MANYYQSRQFGLLQRKQGPAWRHKTANERAAAILYPHLATEEDRQAMKVLADMAGRKAPQDFYPFSKKRR